MKADYLTYKTATTMALWGLVVQLVLAGSMAVYAVLNSDHAVLTWSIFVGAGVLAWLTLVIVFDQHRRERIEAMEADALAQTGGESASVFSTQDDLRPAARRLAGLHKFFVPGMSLVIGAILLGMGIWRFVGYRHLATKTDFSPMEPKAPELGIVLGLVAAILGFIIARFAAGMGKQTAWGNLRAGASYAAGTALLGLVFAIAFVVAYVGPNTILDVMPYVAAGFCVLIGVEVLINFLLGLYRPRRAGEIPPAAFGSRLLGLVAAPDRIAKSVSEAINYQLGFDVTGNWFYQLLNKALFPLIGAGVLIVWLLSCLTVVQPHQRAMILRFGEPVGEELEPGLHLKRPWPIDKMYVPELYRKDADRLTLLDRTVTGLRTLQLGTRSSASNEPMLWTNDHPGEEIYQFVRANAPGEQSTPVSRAGGKAGDLVDLAMVSVELPLQYIVSDVRKFDELGPAELRDELLKAVGQRTVTRYFQKAHLDEVLGYGRNDISKGLMIALQQAYDELNPDASGTPRGAGVQVVYIGIAGVHPPKDTAPSFEARVMADARKIANIQSAEADRIATLTQVVGNVGLADEIVTAINELSDLKQSPKPDAAKVADHEAKISSLIERADGKAASLIAAAKADRWKTHMAAASKASRYEGQVRQYQASPKVYAARSYFDAMTDLFKDSRLFISGQSNAKTWYVFDGQDKDLGLELFTKPTEE